MSGEWKRICLCFVMKVGLDFTPRWCSSDDDKTSQRQVLRAQVASVALFYQGQQCQLNVGLAAIGVRRLFGYLDLFSLGPSQFSLS